MKEWSNEEPKALARVKSNRDEQRFRTYKNWQDVAVDYRKVEAYKILHKI